MILNPVTRHRERCREARALMSEYLDGGLDRRTAAAVARHVRWCSSCRRMLGNLRRTIGALRLLAERPPPSDPTGGHGNSGRT